MSDEKEPPEKMSPYDGDSLASPRVLEQRQKAWDTFRAATGAADDPQHRDRFFCGRDAAYNHLAREGR